eukprot:4535329-Amphidinium_carterae.1
MFDHQWTSAQVQSQTVSSIRGFLKAKAEGTPATRSFDERAPWQCSFMQPVALNAAWNQMVLGVSAEWAHPSQPAPLSQEASAVAERPLERG